MDSYTLALSAIGVHELAQEASKNGVVTYLSQQAYSLLTVLVH